MIMSLEEPSGTNTRSSDWGKGEEGGGELAHWIFLMDSLSGNREKRNDDVCSSFGGNYEFYKETPFSSWLLPLHWIVSLPELLQRHKVQLSEICLSLKKRNYLLI